MAKLNVVIPAADVEVIGEGGVKTKYRKVERKAQVGDIVKALVGSADIDAGAFYGPVRADDRGILGFEDNVSDLRTLQLSMFSAAYEVLEPIAQPTQPKRLTVGDYARVIVDRTTSDRDPISGGAVGDIVEVVKVDGSNVPYRVKTIEGAKVGDMNWSREWALEYVDKAEFLAQKTFKVGEYVKVTDASGAGAANDGDIGVITNDNWGGGSIGRHTVIDVKTLDGREYGMFAYRFVRATEAEVEAAREAAKQALKYGDFTDGDYAQIVNATDDNSDYNSRSNAGKFVTVTRETQSGAFRGLKLALVSDGGFAGYANADALRKVTREEYEAAVDPRNQFAKGDKVRLISGGGKRFACDYEDGGIYTVVNPRYDSVDIQITGGGQQFAYVRPSQLEKVSAEEIAEIERKQAEESKWAALGRKVGEFKRGDIVKVIRVPNGVTNGHKEGAIGEVVSDTTVVNERRGNPHIKVSGVSSQYRNNAVIIVPVEQRFDREQAA